MAVAVDVLETQVVLSGHEHQLSLVKVEVVQLAFDIHRVVARQVLQELVQVDLLEMLDEAVEDLPASRSSPGSTSSEP